MKKKKKTLILVKDRKSFNKAQMLKKELLKENEEVFIVADFYIDNIDTQEVRTVKYYQDFFNFKLDDDLRKCHSFICSIEEAQITPQLTFKDLTVYNEVPLWKMSTRYLLSELIPFFKDLRLAYEIIKLEMPQEIIILGNSGRLENIFRAICFSRGILVTLDKKRAFAKLLKGYLFNLAYNCNNFLRFLKSLYFKWVNLINTHDKERGQNSVVIFFNYLERYFDSILPLIKRYEPCERLVINMPFSDRKIRIKNENIHYKEFYGFLVYRIFDTERNRFLYDIWKSVNASYSFRNEFNYENIVIWDLLKEVFWNLIFRVFPDQIRNVDITRKIILSHKTKCIVVTDNSCEIVFPAKSLGIPTVSIVPNTPEEIIFYGGVISDYITASGEYWKDILLKSGAKNEQIFVVGPPKFDLVLNAEFQKSEIFKELGLDENKKTVVYIGTYPDLGGFDNEDYLLQINMVYRGLKNIKNVNLVTKVHPYVTNLNIYQKIANEQDCKKMLVIRDYNIWKLLYCCDLVIADFSTVIYEAIIMNKIVVLLSHTYKYFDSNVRNIEKSGVALFIKDFSDLESSVNNALNNYEVQGLLHENRNRYIKQHAWPLDGKAAFRMKDLIEQISLRSFPRRYNSSKDRFRYFKQKENIYA